MSTSLSNEDVELATAGLSAANAAFARRFPGEPQGRQPVHTVYGGAHLFHADTPRKLGAGALRALDEYAPDVETFRQVFGLSEHAAPIVMGRVRAKLEREPVEDLRIDFEDGYGVRPDAEEDGHAVGAANEVARALDAGTLPPLVGFRIKPLDEEQRVRAVRTLDLFLTALARAPCGRVPPGFVVTLPKITVPEEASALAALLDALEARIGVARGAIGLELMIETPQALLVLPELAAASRGRCVAAHLGAYDLTAALGIVAAHQVLSHPACDHARHTMATAYAQTGIRLSDGATTLLPIGPHRGRDLTDEQRAENRRAVHRAWRLHHDNVRRALENGFYQGWDLHPAQLPARYAAVHAFFLDVKEESGERLRRFVKEAARATQQGGVFDDAATAQGLLNVFLRAVSSGAISEEEAAASTSLTAGELGSRSFAAIVRARSGR